MGGGRAGMQEPSRPTWEHDPQRAFDPPCDSLLPPHLRLTPATRSVFDWCEG
jgi:hypothetical protein